ncbi:MAG: hypothetical protein DRO67_08860 [Candidatus Asgardarchaeum californiense]|nr:MAG: hypothetical protein DRO67_08860 [Candidatus Asgardarchaeum californiense]
MTMKIETEVHETGTSHKTWKFMVLDDYEIEIIATVNIIETEDYVEIKYINVSRSNRGMGIGSKLLEKVITTFKERTIIVETFSEREHWYQRFGFYKIHQKNNIIKMVRHPNGKRRNN